jgi:YVTN family beta-propeller protein
VVDVPSQRVVGTVPVGHGPLGIAVHPDGTRVYVANYADGTVTVVGTAANQRLRTIRVGRRPFAVAVDPTGARVYVSSVGAGAVTVIDAASAEVTMDIPVGDYPFGLAIDPVSQQVGVATGGVAGRLTLLDPLTGATASSSSVGAVPVSLGQFIGAHPGDCPTKPLQCDDANPATLDTCSAAGCRHDPLPPTDGAPASAAALGDALAAAPPGTLGTGDEVTRLATLVASIEAALPLSPAQPTAAGRRRALRELRTVMHLLVRLAKQPDVQPAVADRLLDLARSANRLVRRLKLS